MPIITNVSHRSQQSYGRFKPVADTSKFAVAFAAVEGKTGSEWPTLRDITSNGVPIFDGSKSSLVYNEFRDENGKPHDVVLSNGAIVRECIVPIEDAQAATAMEAAESTRSCKNFLTKEQVQERSQLGGMLTMKGQLSTTEENSDGFSDPGLAPRRGRPPSK